MHHLRAAAFALLIVLAGGPVVTVFCEAGCRSEAAAASAAEPSCHSSMPGDAAATTISGRALGECNHGGPLDAIVTSFGSRSGSFHRAAVEGVISSAMDGASGRAPAAPSLFLAPAPPKKELAGFTVPLRI